jgi:hypothetical protein
MKVQRSNVLAFGPVPVAWLSLPLTQERAAAIVQFEARTGMPILDALMDALDDIVFDIADGRPGTLRGAPHPDRLPRANEFASEGQVTCVQPTRSESEKPDKSSEDCVSDLTKSSDLSFPTSQNCVGRTKPQPLSPPSLNPMSERPIDGYQVSTSLQLALCSPQLTERSVNICGND